MLATALLLSTSAVHIQEGQTRFVSFDTAHVCEACAIQATRVLTIGDQAAGQLFGAPITVVQAKSGHYYVVSAQAPFEISVFDSRGRFERTIGREGGGPGEYKRITALAIGSSDSLYVFDPGNARVTVLTDTGTVRRTAPVPGNVMQGVPVQNGAVVLNTVIATPDHIGFPLFAVADTGIIAAFGTDDPIYRPDMPFIVMRALARSDSSVVSARRTEYVIEEWDPSGARLRVIQRRAPWFAPYMIRPKITQDQPIRPWLTAISNIRDEMVLAVIAVPVPNWRDRWREFDLNERTLFRPEVRMQDAVIEALDLKTGQIVGSIRLRENVLGLASDSAAYSYRLNDQSDPAIDIWRLHVINRTR